VYKHNKPKIPSNSVTDLDRRVVAITEPRAMVMAKSKLDILLMLRLPEILVKKITEIYINRPLKAIAKAFSEVISNKVFIRLI